MDGIKDYLDYNAILIDNYKKLGLNEEELALLLLVDLFEKQNPSLITGETLSLKTTLDEQKVDEILTSLIERNFLSYETVNNIMVTSLKPLKEKILDLFKRDFLLSPASDILTLNDEGNNEVFKVFEQKMNRSLTSLELDAIRSWLSEGIKKEVIIDALNEHLQKAKRVSFKALDKIILKNLTSNDRKKEGYSVIDEAHKQNIDDAIKIASYNWIKKDNE